MAADTADPDGTVWTGTCTAAAECRAARQERGQNHDNCEISDHAHERCNHRGDMRERLHAVDMREGADRLMSLLPQSHECNLNSALLQSKAA